MKLVHFISEATQHLILQPEVQPGKQRSSRYARMRPANRANLSFPKLVKQNSDAIKSHSEPNTPTSESNSQLTAQQICLRNNGKGEIIHRATERKS